MKWGSNIWQNLITYTLQFPDLTEFNTEVQCAIYDPPKWFTIGLLEIYK